MDGFKFTDGQMRPAHARVLREQPRRLIGVFLRFEQHEQAEDLLKQVLTGQWIFRL